VTKGACDWTSPGDEPNGYGAVYFEDIILRKGPAEDIYYDGSVYLDKDPFENGYQNWPLLLKQDCRLIDAGGDYIDGKQYLIGKTTAWEGTPDNNVADIGFHYFNWYYVNAWDSDSSFADLDDNNTIDLRDFAILANGWETTYDINDLKIMSDRWLWKAEAHPPIAVNITSDPCNISNDIEIGVTGCDTRTERVFVLMDGEFVDEIADFNDIGYVVLESQRYNNGQHTIKAIAVDANSLVTVSENITINFTNDIYCVASSDRFKRREDYHVYGLNLSAENLRIKLKDWEDNIVWMSSGNSADVNFAIPSDMLTRQIYDVVIEKSGESWEQIWERAIGKDYEPNSFYKFAIFLPNGRDEFGNNSSECRKRAVAEVVRICESKGWQYVVLYRGECTWRNFESVLSEPSVKYVYLVCHGGIKNYGSTDVPIERTFFKISGSWGFGTDIVVSYRTGLPEKIINTVHSMKLLGLGTKEQLRLVQVDGCIQTEYEDMAKSWIDFSEGFSVSQLFSGYKTKCQAFDPDWQQWSYDLWHELSNGSSTYYQVIEEIQKPSHNPKGSQIRECVYWHGWDQIILDW
jgi:hypothetical protein